MEDEPQDVGEEGVWLECFSSSPGFTSFGRMEVLDKIQEVEPNLDHKEEVPV